MKLAKIALIGLVILGADGLRAQTVAQTVSFNETTIYTAVSGSVQHVGSSFFLGTFNPFDASLGTLDSFVIEWTLANTGTGNFGGAGGSISMSVSGSLTFNESNYRGGIVSADATGGPPLGAISLSAPIAETDTFLVSGAGSDYDSAFFDAVTGEGSVSIGYNAPVDFSIGSGTATFDASTSGSVQLTYNYTPAAVPEPATYALLAGLGVIGLAVYRRRRH